MKRAALFLFFAVIALPLCAERSTTPVVTTKYFAFYDDYDTNLHDALITAGLARKAGKPELFHAGDEVACFDKLRASQKAGWDEAVDYYLKVVSPGGFGSRAQFLTRMQLAGFAEEVKDESARELVDITGHIRAAASPAYQACRWPIQVEANRKFIDELKPKLDAHEKQIAERLQELYAKKWPVLPIPVDIVETVDWSGANSYITPQHLLVSRTNQPASSLELVFHEASHGLMDRPDPVRKSLDDAATAATFELPRDLWHVVLFYTTGETVRRVVGDMSYKPILYQIFDRGDWTEYRAALEKTWLPYVAGKRSLPAASKNLIDDLRTNVRKP